MSYSLLEDEIFSVKTGRSSRSLALPGVLDALSRDDVDSFEALQPHQEQAWYSFLVQIGAMAAVRAHGGSIPSGPDEWIESLLELSGGSRAAWSILVDDLNEPGFLQPPVPEGSLEEANYKSDIPSPSDLDVLVTSKNHDVKQRRIVRPRLEHWVYALITLQTMEGFLGRGNYGIVRMNGGFGNRPLVGLSPELSFGARFRRDVDVLVDHHDELDTLYNPTGGLTLVWTEPWDGRKESAIPLKRCDPYFIEVCRRIRFTEESGELTCWRANTKGQRIDAPSSLDGRTEDPWTPVDVGEEKALTLGGSGFTYEKLQQILLGDQYARPPALEIQETDSGSMYLIARAMVRGQGKTEGLHHRIVPIPDQVSVLFREEDDRERLAKRAKHRVQLTSEVESRILRPAVAALLSAGREGQVDWDQVEPWVEAFDRVVDDHFFDHLWESVHLESEEADRSWKKFLRMQAEENFKRAQEAAPVPDIRRWRALSAARSVFYARCRDVLGELETAA